MLRSRWSVLTSTMEFDSPLACLHDDSLLGTSISGSTAAELEAELALLGDEAPLPNPRPLPQPPFAACRAEPSRPPFADLARGHKQKRQRLARPASPLLHNGEELRPPRAVVENARVLGRKSGRTVTFKLDHEEAACWRRRGDNGRALPFTPFTQD